MTVFGATPDFFDDTWTLETSVVSRQSRLPPAGGRSTFLSHAQRQSRNECLGMSLIIYVAHSGNKIVAEPTKINSLDALRAWVQRSAHIPVNKQVFLTSKGKAVQLLLLDQYQSLAHPGPVSSEP
jgi:hypothetical protein